VIGLPAPGTTLKLVPNEENRYEVRVRGPNITQGYYQNQAATTAAFDEEGYYQTGDAVAFYDRDNPNAGVIFDGRIGEDFKLTSGVWVRNAQLRASINGLGKPYVLEVVLAAPNRPYLNALVIPNVAALRQRFVELAAVQPNDEQFLNSEPVVELFRVVFQQHNEGQTGSSKRFEKFAILSTPPQFDTGEMTDKGYINQQAVLRNYATLVGQFYDDAESENIWRI
jgi:feruloyl-CoA synthase